MSEKGYLSFAGILERFGSVAIDFIVFAKDKNVIKDYSKEIENLAKRNGIKAFEKSDDYVIQSKYILAISWRWLIPTNRENILVALHDSLLPKYRGFAPLVNQLINKEREIGVTAIIANGEYDKGDIIAQLATEVNYPIRIQDAILKVSVLYVEIINKVIEQVVNDIPLKTIKQNENDATYSLWRDEEDYRINWRGDASDIQNFIFSVGFPYQGASSFLMGEKVRINEAIVLNDVMIENRCAGKIIFLDKLFPVVVCGKGLLKITNAVFDKNADSIFPLKKFRLRFS